MSKTSLKNNIRVRRVGRVDTTPSVISFNGKSSHISPEELNYLLEKNGEAWSASEKRAAKVQPRDPYVWQSKSFDNRGRANRDSKFYVNGEIVHHEQFNQHKPRTNKHDIRRKRRYSI